MGQDVGSLSAAPSEEEDVYGNRPVSIIPSSASAHQNPSRLTSRRQRRKTSLAHDPSLLRPPAIPPAYPPASTLPYTLPSSSSSPSLNLTINVTSSTFETIREIEEKMNDWGSWRPFELAYGATAVRGNLIGDASLVDAFVREILLRLASGQGLVEEYECPEIVHSRGTFSWFKTEFQNRGEAEEYHEGIRDDGIPTFRCLLLIAHRELSRIRQSLLDSLPFDLDHILSHRSLFGTSTGRRLLHQLESTRSEWESMEIEMRDSIESELCDALFRKITIIAQSRVTSTFTPFNPEGEIGLEEREQRRRLRNRRMIVQSLIDQFQRQLTQWEEEENDYSCSIDSLLVDLSNSANNQNRFDRLFTFSSLFCLVLRRIRLYTTLRTALLQGNRRNLKVWIIRKKQRKKLKNRISVLRVFAQSLREEITAFWNDEECLREHTVDSVIEIEGIGDGDGVEEDEEGDEGEGERVGIQEAEERFWGSEGSVRSLYRFLRLSFIESWFEKCVSEEEPEEEGEGEEDNVISDPFEREKNVISTFRLWSELSLHRSIRSIIVRPIISSNNTEDPSHFNLYFDALEIRQQTLFFSTTTTSDLESTITARNEWIVPGVDFSIAGLGPFARFHLMELKSELKSTCDSFREEEDSIPADTRQKLSEVAELLLDLEVRLGLDVGSEEEESRNGSDFMDWTFVIEDGLSMVDSRSEEEIEVSEAMKPLHWNPLVGAMASLGLTVVSFGNHISQLISVFREMNADRFKMVAPASRLSAFPLSIQIDISSDSGEAVSESVEIQSTDYVLVSLRGTKDLDISSMDENSSVTISVDDMRLFSCVHLALANEEEEEEGGGEGEEEGDAQKSTRRRRTRRRGRRSSEFCLTDFLRYELRKPDDSDAFAVVTPYSLRIQSFQASVPVAATQFISQPQTQEVVTFTLSIANFGEFPSPSHWVNLHFRDDEASVVSNTYPLFSEIPPGQVKQFKMDVPAKNEVLPPRSLLAVLSLSCGVDWCAHRMEQTFSIELISDEVGNSVVGG